MKNKDKALIGNEKIEEAISVLADDFSEENLARLLTIIRGRIHEGGQVVVAVDAGGINEFSGLQLKTANYNGEKWFVAFTSFEEEIKGGESVISGFMADIEQLFDLAYKSGEVEGILMNPFGNLVTLNKSIIEVIIK